MPDRETRRRGSLGLTARRGVHLRPDTAAAVERISESTGLAAGALLRECVEAGLPAVRDRYRAARRRAADAGTDSAAGR